MKPVIYRSYTRPKVYESHEKKTFMHPFFFGLWFNFAVSDWHIVVTYTKHHTLIGSHVRQYSCTIPMYSFKVLKHYANFAMQLDCWDLKHVISWHESSGFDKCSILRIRFILHITLNQVIPSIHPVPSIHNSTASWARFVLFILVYSKLFSDSAFFTIYSEILGYL